MVGQQNDPYVEFPVDRIVDVHWPKKPDGGPPKPVDCGTAGPFVANMASLGGWVWHTAGFALGGFPGGFASEATLSGVWEATLFGPFPDPGSRMDNVQIGLAFGDSTPTAPTVTSPLNAQVMPPATIPMSCSLSYPATEGTPASPMLWYGIRTDPVALYPWWDFGHAGVGVGFTGTLTINFTCIPATTPHHGPAEELLIPIAPPSLPLETRGVWPRW